MNNFDKKDTQENKINQDSTIEKIEPLDTEDNQKDENITDSALTNNDLEKINNELTAKINNLEQKNSELNDKFLRSLAKLKIFVADRKKKSKKILNLQLLILLMI